MSLRPYFEYNHQFVVIIEQNSSKKVFDLIFQPKTMLLILVFVSFSKKKLDLCATMTINTNFTCIGRSRRVGTGGSRCLSVWMVGFLSIISRCVMNT